MHLSSWLSLVLVSAVAAYPQLPVPSFRLLSFHYRGYTTQSTGHARDKTADKAPSCCSWQQVDKELREQQLPPPPVLSTDGSYSGSSAARLTLALLKSLPPDAVVLGRLRNQWRQLRDAVTFPAAFSTLFRDPSFVRRASPDGHLLRNTHHLLEGRRGIFRLTWLKSHHRKGTRADRPDLESAVGLWDCSGPVRAPDWSRQHRPVVLLEFWQALDEPCGNKQKSQKSISYKSHMKAAPKSSVLLYHRKQKKLAGVLSVRHSKHRQTHRRSRDHRRRQK